MHLPRISTSVLKPIKSFATEAASRTSRFIKKAGSDSVELSRTALRKADNHPKTLLGSLAALFGIGSFAAGDATDGFDGK